MKRYLPLLSLLVILFNFFPAVQTVRAEAGPEFIKTECDPMLVTGVIDPDTVTCGTVAVPEFHDQPNGKTISLSVIVLHARGENPAPDPLIMAQGGPGGSTIETYTSTLLMKPDILNDRDVVLFDQRGTLHSDPSLVCPEVVDFSFATIDEVIDPKQGNSDVPGCFE